MVCNGQCLDPNIDLPRVEIKTKNSLITVHALKKLTFYERTTPTAMGVLRSRLRTYYAYGYGRTCLRLRVYYAYGYGRVAATNTGVLQAYYGRAAGCKLTFGHYSCNHER